MAKSRRKVDNQQVDVDLGDEGSGAIVAPELPEPSIKPKRGRPRKKAVEDTVAPSSAAADAVVPSEEGSSRVDDSPVEGDVDSDITPSLAAADLVESPVIQSSPPAVAVPEDPKKEVAAAVPAPRRGKKSVEVNPETSRFWHLKRMR